jgi:hypothetical protein
MTSATIASTRYAGLVLAIQPTFYGFGWVLFENPNTVVAWSLVHARAGRDMRLIKRFIRLLDRYEPAVLVLESFRADCSRRNPRIRELCHTMTHEANSRGISVSVFDREIVQMVFAKHGAATRDEIAQVISEHIPAFAHRRPRTRKSWRSDDSRRSLFDAAALAITYFSAMGDLDLSA